MVFSKSGYCTMCFSGERERLSHHSQQHLVLWQEVSRGGQLGPRLPGGTSLRLGSKKDPGAGILSRRLGLCPMRDSEGLG